MKRFATVLLISVAACHRGTAPTGSGTGAGSPEAAVNAFIAAAKAQDIQAMSTVWGTARGPVRATMPRDEMDQRLIIMMQLMCQEDARVVGKSPAPEGKQFVRVELKRGATAVQLNFTTVEGPSSRWYVFDFDNSRLQTFCRPSPSPTR
ncbi:MAG TPA: hypothetical protein VJR92_11975 [Gemmatimonadaceae bacterium]|nr:hypothetical protein [Gemmatimonadaceae bacterium]